MLTFTKDLVANNQQVRNAYQALKNRRVIFNRHQRSLGRDFSGAITANQMADVAKDYWKEVDAVTTRVVRHDQGKGLVSDLMAMATPIGIGKTEALYRTSSDIDTSVTVSMSGQAPEELGKVIYSLEGDLMPVFKTGYGREWREWMGMSDAGLDAMSDDQEAATAKIVTQVGEYMLVGQPTLKHGTSEAKGLLNHKNSKVITSSNLDFKESGSSTNDDIINFFTKDLAKELDDEYIDSKIVLWVSPQVKRRLGVPLSKSDGFKGGTLEQEILRFGRVESINQTFLLEGNRMTGYVRDGLFVRPRVAAAIGSYMQTRNDPHDNYNTLVWTALGLQIKKDFNGRKRAFYIKGKDVTRDMAQILAERRISSSSSEEEYKEAQAHLDAVLEQNEFDSNHSVDDEEE